MEHGRELIVTLIFLPSAQVMGEGEKDQKGSEEDRRAKESLFQLLQFSRVFTSACLRQADLSRRGFNLRGDGQSLTASFFGVSASVLDVQKPSLCAACACNPSTSLPSLIGAPQP